MNSRYRAVSFGLIFLIFLFVYCTDQGQSEEEKIARSYCSSCHLFPEPSLLDKTTWEKSLLPKMGTYLGIAYMGKTFFVNSLDEHGAATDSSHYNISYQNWSAIVNYYTTNAPAKLDSQNRPHINQLTNRFVAKEGIIKGSDPTTTYVQIDPGNKRIYASTESDSLFCIFDSDLNLLSKKNIHSVIVDAQFAENILTPGLRTGVLTNIGIIYPNDIRSGSLERFQIGNNGIRLDGVIDRNLPRPVQSIAADFDKDNKVDYLVCGFGYNTGSFFYLRGLGDNKYERKILNPIPGAIRAYVEDYNNDGLSDIVVLFAQAQEGIYVYLNKGNGNFQKKPLLQFPSVYGSTYFEMLDVNKDGLKDIVYTCGDNLDYSRVLKNYHGVYIYINQGGDRFKQEYFFAINGCYKALMRDFDKDGDLDIATISYFPDIKNQPQESFVYLENQGRLNFTPSTIKQFNRGNWVNMDAGDVDGDGDEDIVIGSLVFYFTPPEVTSGVTLLPNFLLLVNQTK